jgi:UDP-glucose 6-dehydrogenase
VPVSLSKAVQVLCVDINPLHIDKLKRGEISIYEAGLEAVLCLNWLYFKIGGRDRD